MPCVFCRFRANQLNLLHFVTCSSILDIHVRCNVGGRIATTCLYIYVSVAALYTRVVLTAIPQILPVKNGVKQAIICDRKENTKIVKVNFTLFIRSI